MKLRLSITRSSFLGSSARAGGFTLTEILIAMAIFVLVVGGILTAHIFGLRMFQLNEKKLNTTEWSRDTFGKFADEVRSAHDLMIGNYTNGFEGLLDNEPQQGNALLIYPTTSTNKYIIYYVGDNPSVIGDTIFQRITEQNNSTVILAHFLTNTMVFSGKSFAGDLLNSTTSGTNSVIHLTLEFYQPESFMQEAQQYKLETSVTRHADP